MLVAHEVQALGGMEGQLVLLVRELLALGWRITVVARRCEVEHPALDHVAVRGPRAPFPLWYAWFALAAGIVLRRPSLRGLPVHTTGALVPNRARVSTVHYCHAAARAAGVGERTSRATAAHRLSSRLSLALSLAGERWCYRPARTKRIAAVSTGVAREVAEHYPAAAASISVVTNVVDALRFRPRPEERDSVRGELDLDAAAPVAVFVGGDWDRKGVDLAIAALPEAPGWTLLVVGAGDEPRYRGLAQEAGVADRVRFAGVRRDVERVYAACDAFVLPTAYETFSLVTYEAAAAGVPIVATRVSGIEDLLRDGENGVEITRDPASIAGALRRLDDPAERERMGAAGRGAVERLPSARDIAAEYEALYVG